jgi:muconolactone D-isomerase
MEFLVEIQIDLPVDTPSDERDRLVGEEARRSRELGELGHLVRIWRIPGRWANVGIWQAEDATQLHQVLSSLPLFPWMDVQVRPLAAHPADPAKRE